MINDPTDFSFDLQWVFHVRVETLTSSFSSGSAVKQGLVIWARTHKDLIIVFTFYSGQFISPHFFEPFKDREPR